MRTILCVAARSWAQVPARWAPAPSQNQQWSFLWPARDNHQVTATLGMNVFESLFVARVTLLRPSEIVLCSRKASRARPHGQNCRIPAALAAFATAVENRPPAETIQTTRLRQNRRTKLPAFPPQTQTVCRNIASYLIEKPSCAGAFLRILPVAAGPKTSASRIPHQSFPAIEPSCAPASANSHSSDRAVSVCTDRGPAAARCPALLSFTISSNKSIVLWPQTTSWPWRFFSRRISIPVRSPCFIFCAGPSAYGCSLARVNEPPLLPCHNTSAVFEGLERAFL